INSHISSAPQVDDNTLKQLMTALAKLRGAKFAGQLDEMSPPPLEPLRQRVEKELDGRFQTIRNNCDKWIPGSPLSDGEVTKLADVLNTAVAVKPLSLPECERYRAALTVQRIRVDARSAKPDWSQLLSELPPLDAIQQTIERDYVVVLRYLFEATEADKKLQLTQKPAEQISTLTEQFEAYPDVRNILDRPSISKWEKDQIAGVLKSLDGRMDLDWLRQDSRLRDAVRRIPALPSYSAAQDPDAWSLGRAAQFRREGKFSEARRELDQIGDGERARDERLALALVDPAARADLQTELGNPDFDRWERVTSLLQDQYKLSSPDTIDETKITSERAALIKVMQSECLLHAGKDADEALDRYVERLSEPQFKPYALYIQALALEKSAAAKTGSAQTAVWSEASDKLINAYQPLLGADQQLPADSPLASSERRTRARAILFQAISRWSGDKRPTDNDYGSSTVFGGHAAQAFKNLALVRKLTGPQSVRQDYLLAAAVAAWDEVVDPANAAELLSISNELIQSAEPDAKLQPLLGTVYAARCKAQVVSQASPQSLLESAAEALQRLYLDALPPANDPAALAEARLKRIESDLIKPVLPAADAMWNKRADDPKSDASASPLARFYRAAGFMFREPCIADPLRLRGDSPDEWAYQYLQRANDLSAEPHPQTLIAQGRALWDVRSTHPDSGKDMTELAMRAIGAAPSEPAVLARAYGLEALGRLTLARDERFSTDQRKTNLAGALARINEAIAIAQQASEPPAEFAAWLVTRATINVEFANHGGPDPVALLTSARDDAQQAVKLQLSENPHFAYLALGNALEDLAFYQCFDAEENYQRACESFQKAVELTQPVGPVSMHDEKHLSALRSLLRCRQRWADSGALQSPSEEVEQLDSARADASSLVFLDPQETVVEDLDPHNGANIAELCYFRSLAYRGLAARSSDDAERRALTASADADLLNAVEWARLSSAWESWAQYQLVLGRLQKDSGKLDAAAAAYQSVLELEQPQGVQLPPKLIFDALVQLSRCNKDQGQPWTSERWDNERARFSAEFPSSEYYNLSCRICKMAALQPDAWEQAEIDAIDVLVNDLARDESTFLDIEDLRYNWLSCQVFRAVALADLAAAQIKEQKDIQLKRQKLSESLEHQKVAADLCAQALAIKDRALMATAAQPLEQLQDGGMDWDAVMALPGSVRKALFNHLARTFELRRRLVEANVTLISHYPKDELIRQSGQRSLQLAPKELAKEFPGVVPPDWAQKYPLYLAAFSKRS
ncbi:MAG: hypothetical protein IT424_13970, partial [Pirellulales bacterium]|nr:hypothetical protein [Pirellulales bacterium]